MKKEYELHKRNFIAVAGILARSENETDRKAYRIAWKKPYKFYTDIETALNELRKEAATI